MEHKRGVVLLIGIGLLSMALTTWFMMRVRRGAQPTSPSDAAVVTTAPGSAPKLQTETVLGGLSHPWDVGFLPDNTAIFTERAGSISKVAAGRKSVLATVSGVRAGGEDGLMGLVVDPDFDTNRFVYACYNTASDIRVSRWRVNPAVTALIDQINIVTGLPASNAGRHSGCRPRFGADGYLWIGTGDVAVGANPQNPKSLGGKILRVDRGGKPAPGNLNAPFDPRIFSYGHRNVQGLAMLPSAAYGVYGFSVEHGSSQDDEVNPLRSGNMGWDPAPDYNESVPMTDKQKFPAAIEPMWRSGERTIAPSGATFLQGEKWRAFKGRIAMAVLKDQHVRLLELDASGKLASEEILFQETFGRIRSAVSGPFNDLYLTTDNGDGTDKIIKVSPQ